jgi:drug/metabolite transporter (DMT)-like permease
MGNNASENKELSLVMSLVAILLCSSFGANIVAIKLSLAGLGVFTTAGLRFLIAAVAISLWAWMTGKSFALKKGQFKHIIILSFLFTMQLGLFYWGVNKTYASRATLLINIQPFFVLILAHFFLAGDKISAKNTLAMILGFAGVVFIVTDKQNIAAQIRFGDLIIVIGAVIWAGNAIYTKKIIHNFKSYQIVLYPMILSLPLFFLAGIIFDNYMVSFINIKIIGSLLYQGLVTASLGFIWWMKLIKKYKISSLHLFFFIIPVAGVFFSHFILKEPLSANIVISLILITSGIMCLHLRGKEIREDEYISCHKS